MLLIPASGKMLTHKQRYDLSLDKKHKNRNKVDILIAIYFEGL